MDSVFRGLVRILAYTAEILAKSSVYLAVGFFLAGLVHVFLKGRSFGKNLSTRGLRSILSGIGFGVVLPVCSCGVLPIVVTMKKRGATPESAAAFAVATPENSEDTVLLTAGLFNPVFAAVRVLASFVAGLVAGIFVLASEAWGPPDNTVREDDVPAGEDCHCHRDPPWVEKVKRGLTNLIKRVWARRGAQKDVASSGAHEPTEEGPRSLGSRLRGWVSEIWHFGFREVLDEISWPLLAGLTLSGFLAAALPSDLSRFIPGGILGQMVFAAVIAVPLYLCASASTPLGAVLVSKGLAPAAALVLFLTGPVTNAPAILLIKRQFGRKFLVSILLATLLVSFGLGLVFHALTPVFFKGAVESPALLERGIAAWELVFAFLFGIPFTLSLIRVGAREGVRQIAAAFHGLVPAATAAWLSEMRQALSLQPARKLSMAASGICVLVWLATGTVSIPQESQGFVKILGRVSENPLGPGWHWTVPAPFASVVKVPAGLLLKLDFGFRTAGIPEAGGDDWMYAGNTWHAIYTTPGDNPVESSFVTGDQNVIEIKLAIHVVMTDGRAVAFSLKEGADTIRPLVQDVLRRLAGGRAIDTVLSGGRGELEKEAQALLVKELLAAKLPFKVMSFNILDLHPPQGAVTAFRDVGSAAEDLEKRKYEAMAVAESAIPKARGEAALLESQALATKGERTMEAEGARKAFKEHADAVAASPGNETRTRLYWETAERALANRRLIVAPGSIEHNIVDSLPGKP